MRASHLLFSHGEMILALPAERIQRIQEAGSVVPLPGAGSSVNGLAACGGRSRVVLNLPGLFLFSGTTCPETLSDRPPLWALLDGVADGLVLEIPAPLSFSTPAARTSRPPGSARTPEASRTSATISRASRGSPAAWLPRPTAAPPRPRNTRASDAAVKPPAPSPPPPARST